MILVAIATKLEMNPIVLMILILIPLPSSNSLQNFKQIKKKTPEILHFQFFIALKSVTSYLIKSEAENIQNGDIHLAQIPDFEMEYLENHLAH